MVTVEPNCATRRTLCSLKCNTYMNCNLKLYERYHDWHQVQGEMLGAVEFTMYNGSSSMLVLNRAIVGQNLNRFQLILIRLVVFHIHPILMYNFF